MDRGAHGLELLVLLLGWKLAEPRRVFLLRGKGPPCTGVGVQGESRVGVQPSSGRGFDRQEQGA